VRIAIVVNDVDTEVATAATTIIAHAATRRGHDVFLVGVRELEYFEDGHIGALARVARAGSARTPASFLRMVQGKDAALEVVTSADIDVLFLRYNPSEELGEDAWAQDAGILFARVAVERGVLVLDDPDALAFATDKLYFQHFPEAVRPRTIITRSHDRVVEFHREHGAIVLKPLVGYGGTDVYLVDREADNLKQIVESIRRAGYIIVQEYLPAASKGDIRMFIMNGKPLVVDGKYAAVHRVNPPNDFRSNMTAGGKPAKAKITERELHLAEAVGPRLVADGIFLAGIDIVGDRIVEINTVSPGGLNIAGKLEGVNFGDEVVRAIERKLRYRAAYAGALTNRQLASMD
jgi:glutathione synthase